MGAYHLYHLTLILNIFWKVTWSNLMREQNKLSRNKKFDTLCINKAKVQSKTKRSFKLWIKPTIGTTLCWVTSAWCRRKLLEILPVGIWSIFQVWRVCRQKWAQSRWALQYLGRQSETNILKEIVHIKFESLLWLTLNHNNIESMEALIYLRAPNLRKLWLGTCSFNKTLTIFSESSL